MPVCSSARIQDSGNKKQCGASCLASRILPLNASMKQIPRRISAPYGQVNDAGGRRRGERREGPTSAVVSKFSRQTEETN
jgi:hypothetical protein